MSGPYRNRGRASRPLFVFRPARCERPAFDIGTAIIVRGHRYIVRESCATLTTLGRADAPEDNRLAIDYPTPRLWEALWGRSARFCEAGRLAA